MSKWKLVPVEPTQAMIDATNSVPEGAGYLSCVRAYRAMLDAAPAWQAEPVAWVRNLTDPQPHCVTGLQYRTAADADAGVQYIPVYLHPPAAEVRLQGGLDNEELLEAWRTKVPGVEPTDSDLRAFALGVEFGTRGKRVYFDERNSARDAWRRRVKQCETLEAEVQRLRDAAKKVIDAYAELYTCPEEIIDLRRALEVA